MEKIYSDKNGNLQFIIGIGTKKDSDNVKKQVFSKGEVTEVTNAKEKNNVLKCGNNRMKKEMKYLIADTDYLKKNIIAQNTEIVVLKN